MSSRAPRGHPAVAIDEARMTVVRYGIAGVCVIAAVTLARWLPPEAVADGLLLLAAVVITGRVSGLGPALVACGLATLAFEYYATSSLDQLSRLIVFLLVALPLAVMSATRRKTDLVTQGAEDLETRVRERTAEHQLRDLVNTVEGIVWEADATTFQCDPQALRHGVKMYRTKPEFPSRFALGADVPVDPETAEVFRTVRAASGPVQFGPDSLQWPLPADVAKRLGFQSEIAMALYPKGDQPYMFGLSQCTHPKVWTTQEARLFEEIGRRLGDALTSLLIFRNLEQSERRLEEAQRISHVGH